MWAFFKTRRELEAENDRLRSRVISLEEQLAFERLRILTFAEENRERREAEQVIQSQLVALATSKTDSTRRAQFPSDGERERALAANEKAWEKHQEEKKNGGIRIHNRQLAGARTADRELVHKGVMSDDDFKEKYGEDA